MTIYIQVICLGITGQDCTTTHKVVTGDSCFSISQAAGIELSVLIANNPNVDGACDNIYPDEVGYYSFSFVGIFFVDNMYPHHTGPLHGVHSHSIHQLRQLLSSGRGDLVQTNSHPICHYVLLYHPGIYNGCPFAPRGFGAPKVVAAVRSLPTPTASRHHTRVGPRCSDD